MNQNDFFNILMDGLKDLPETKLQNIISYYENNFTLGLAAGKTEAEIFNELGNPTLIVTKYRTDDIVTTPISASNYNKNTFSNDDSTFNEHQNIITDNNSNDIYNNFKTNDSFSNINSDKNIIASNSTLNDFKTSDSYEGIDSNATADGQERNYKFINPNVSNNTANCENDLNSNKSHKNSDNYNINNSSFNSKRNSDNFSNSSTDQNSNKRVSQLSINVLLRICIAVLALIIFFPVITGVIGCIIGLFGVAISILVASIGVLVGGTFTSFMGFPNVPAFVANFPYPVIVLFSLGSISLSILLIFLFYYLCKFLTRLSIKIYNLFKSQGGAF